MNSARLDICLAILYHATQLTGGKPVRIRDLAYRYINSHDADGFYDCLASPGNHDYVDFSDREQNISDRKVQITLRGVERIEAAYGENVASFLEQRGIQYNYGALDVVADHPEAFDSRSWTGIEKRLQSDPDLLEAIRLKLREVDALVDEAGLTNVERQKAKAISEALIKLVESPEPEWKAIVELLNSKPLTAILNVTVVIQLALKLIFGI